MKHAGLLVMFGGSALIGTLTLFDLVGNAEPALWLALAFAGAFTFVRTRERPVRYAFPATAVASLVAPVIHVSFLPVLLSHHPELRTQLANIPAGYSPGVFLLAMSPVVALAYAGVTTLVTLAVWRMARRTA
jgi:hypothetical protein